MQWFQRVIEWSKFSARTVAAAERLADECFDAVLPRLRQDVLAMSTAESRGYIRARAELVVRGRINRMLAAPEYKDLQQAEVRRLTHEAIARNAVKQLRLNRARHAVARAA